MIKYLGHKFKCVKLYNSKYTEEEWKSIILTLSKNDIWYSGKYYKCISCNTSYSYHWFIGYLNSKQEILSCNERTIKNLLE